MGTDIQKHKEEEKITNTTNIIGCFYNIILQQNWWGTSSLSFITNYHVCILLQMIHRAWYKRQRLNETFSEKKMMKPQYKDRDLKAYCNVFHYFFLINTLKWKPLCLTCDDATVAAIKHENLKLMHADCFIQSTW